MLARAYTAVGDIDAAREQGNRVQETLQRQLQITPTDLKLRMQLVEATVFLEQFPEALAIIKQALDIFSDDEPTTLALRQATAGVYIACYDCRERQGNASPAEQFKLLAAGMNANPNEIQLFQRLMTLLTRRDQTAETAARFLRSMLARGEATALVHLLLGTDAAERGEQDVALQHLEQACRIDPNMQFAANNLAWELAHSDPPELDRALALINVVVERDPNLGYYRDTRGQILAKLGRWDEALIDLEAALPQLPGNLQLRETLVQAYSKLGMPEVAEEHRRIAAEMRKAATRDKGTAN
jgi:tetratricopeptide (TPR) repeat protein